MGTVDGMDQKSDALWKELKNKFNYTYMFNYK